MNCLVGGSSGLVGSALCARLVASGHTVDRLVRHQGEGVRWDADSYRLARPEQVNGYDAAVHLGGESIVGRWTKEKKARIWDSRVRSTAALAEQLAQADAKPQVWVVASATGYYGDRGPEELTEESISGSGFLSDVCRAWEEAAEPARQAGIRVVHVRFGMVLSPTGGALKAMLPPFKMGLGGRIGSGHQFMSWVSLDDVIGAVIHALTHEALHGPVNVVSPSPCTNRQFTHALGTALSRPTWFPVPAFAARCVFGEMADALLLASQRVYPAKLTAEGYTFNHTDLSQTLHALVGGK